MFWSQPKPCAKSIGCLPRPETLTLLRCRTDMRSGEDNKTGVRAQNLRALTPAKPRSQWVSCSSTIAPLAEESDELEENFARGGDHGRGGLPDAAAEHRAVAGQR